MVLSSLQDRIHPDPFSPFSSLVSSAVFLLVCEGHYLHPSYSTQKDGLHFIPASSTLTSTQSPKLAYFLPFPISQIYLLLSTVTTILPSFLIYFPLNWLLNSLPTGLPVSTLIPSNSFSHSHLRSLSKKCKPDQATSRHISLYGSLLMARQLSPMFSPLLKVTLWPRTN